MRELTPTERFLLRLAYYHNVAVPLREIHTVLQVPPHEAPGILDQLEADGLVERWPEKNAIVLSALGGQRIGFVLTCDKRNRLLWHKAGSRWCRDAEAAFFRSDTDPISTLDVPPEDRPLGRPGTFTEADFRDDEGRGGFHDCDPRGGLADEGIRRKHDHQRHDLDCPASEMLPGSTSAEMAGVVMPTLLIGAGMIWPLEPRADGLCPACWNYTKLPIFAYCLNCDRSGSPNIPTIPAHLKAQLRAKPTKARPDDGLLGGQGKARKKHKRPTRSRPREV